MENLESGEGGGLTLGHYHFVLGFSGIELLWKRGN